MKKIFNLIQRKRTRTVGINKAEKLFDKLGEGISEFTSLKSGPEVDKVWETFWKLKKNIRIHYPFLL